MRFAFTDEQLALRGAVRRVLDRECTTADLRAVAGWSHGLLDRDPGPGAPPAGRSDRRWSVLAELGALGLLVDGADGGLGGDEVDLVGVLEEAGWAALPEPLAESAAVGAPLLGGLAPPAHEALAPWRRALAAGELVVAVGGIEVARDGPVPAGGPLDGAGRWRTPRLAGALRAGAFVLARAVAGGWEVHAVGRAAVAVLPTPSIDATRDLGAVTWTPDPSSVVAEGPVATALVEAAADRGALAAAAQLLGLADRMLVMAADHAKVRHQFGAPIGSFQAVKHLLADARVALEFARPAVYRAADSVARGLPTRRHDVAMAKALASDAADLSARVALQVHGAIGYTWECDLHLFMKRAWALSAAWGDAPTQRAVVLADVVARRRTAGDRPVRPAGSRSAAR